MTTFTLEYVPLEDANHYMEDSFYFAHTAKIEAYSCENAALTLKKREQIFRILSIRSDEEIRAEKESRDTSKAEADRKAAEKKAHRLAKEASKAAAMGLSIPKYRRVRNLQRRIREDEREIEELRNRLAEEKKELSTYIH